MECRSRAKLRLDLPRRAGLRTSVNHDTAELVAQLSTQLGMAFEDAAPVALALGAADKADRPLAVDYLSETLVRAQALFNAITVLMG